MGGKKLKKIICKFIITVFVLLNCCFMSVYATEINSNREEMVKEDSILLNDLNLEDCTDEQITNAVSRATVEECGEWLATMDADQFKELLTRNTWLTKDTMIEKYTCEQYDEETGDSLFKKEDSYTQKYYEYVFSCTGFTPPDKAGMVKASYFANKSGLFYAYFQQKGSIMASSTVRISGIDTSTPISSDKGNAVAQSKLSITVSTTGQYPAGFQAAFGNTTYTRLNTNSNTYSCIWLPFQYTKQAGYAVNIKTSGLFSTNGDFYIEENGTNSQGDQNFENTVKHDVLMKVHIGYNAGVGTSLYPKTSSAAFLFDITPATYKVKYNGNGATVGSVETQICEYGKAYNYITNPFNRQYILTYNPNGGNLSKNVDYVTYTFSNWKNSVNGKEVGENTVFSNLCTRNNAEVSLNAVWDEKGVKLPEGVKTGYELTGWNCESGFIGTDQEYIPEKTEELTALWSPIKYKIEFYADREFNVPFYVQELEYDKKEKLVDVALMNIHREGYEFMNWSSELGQYQDGEEVINLTETKNDTIKLYAVWSIKANQKQDVVIDDDNNDDNNNGNQNTDSNDTDKKEETVINIYDNRIYNYGLTERQVYALLKQLDGGNISKLTIDGVEYSISQNGNGTLEIVFINPNNEKTVTVPSVITLGNRSFQVTAIGNNAFKNNKTIQTVKLSNGIITIGDYAFYGCTKLGEAEMPNTVLKVGKFAFAKCKSLNKVKFSCNCYEMGEGCFMDDSKLKNIDLRGKLASIPNKAFANCKNLKKVMLGSEISELGSKAFYKCNKMSSIKLPSKLQKIGKKSFYNCSKLKKVDFKSKVLNKVGSKAFERCKNSIKFYVPEGKKETYENLLRGKY